MLTYLMTGRDGLKLKTDDSECVMDDVTWHWHRRVTNNDICMTAAAVKSTIEARAIDVDRTDELAQLLISMPYININ